MNTASGESVVRGAFAKARIDISELEIRSYPEETIYVVYVAPDALRAAVDLGNRIDEELTEAGSPAFVAVRQAADGPRRRPPALKLGVLDPRATELTQLLSERSRTSLAQPSLSYVPDIRSSLAAVTAPRHHLIFGRRGAGKTALMIEAKRVVAAGGSGTVWMNLQSYRDQSADRIFLYYVREVADLITTDISWKVGASEVAASGRRLLVAVEALIDQATEPDKALVTHIIPEVQRLLRRYLELTVRRLFVFLDDFYFVSRAEQPLLLDMVHASVRDTDAWLKIASIKHLTRWFQGAPPLGLQTGHDADLLDIDVPLQNPPQAKDFLESVLVKYAGQVGIGSLSSVLSTSALDRLVLASGAVPRDYLVLCAGAMTRAQRRPKAKQVGAQDVNQEAGERAKVKVHELEEDLATDKGTSATALHALQIIKAFCLDEKRFSYFRVDLRDKEQKPDEYNALVSLMDLRLVHLLDPSVSAAHVAGEMSEVFMLDLSQYSGFRLKQNLWVLDLERGVFTARQTGGGEAPQPGRTARALRSCQGIIDAVE
jgi:hypothetical protein